MSSQPVDPSPRRRATRGRRSRRARAHDAAEATLADDASHAHHFADHHGAEHPLIPAEKAEVIQSNDALTPFLDHIRSKGRFAYDTEFIGEETYYPVTCLAQLATEERIAIVDPLAGVGLTPVWELIADPAIETIVHAGQIDLEPIARQFGRPPGNVFDTQIAAAFIGVAYPAGLRQLVEELLGRRMGKGLTFTDWSRRPLSKAHVRYAADDVRYLPALRAALSDRLEKVSHSDWAAEEFAGLSNASRYVFDPGAAYARVIGNRNLESRNRAILRELVILRDSLAREEDVPPRTLLRDDVLLTIARDPIVEQGRLANVSGFPRPLASRHGARFVEATRRALDLPVESRPKRRSPEESPDDRLRIDSLWSAVSAYCLGRLVDPAIVTSRRELAHFYLDTDRPDRFDQPWFTGWREAFLGCALRDLLAGRGRIALEWRDARLHARCEPRADSPATGEPG